MPIPGSFRARLRNDNPMKTIPAIGRVKKNHWRLCPSYDRRCVPENGPAVWMLMFTVVPVPPEAIWAGANTQANPAGNPEQP